MSHLGFTSPWTTSGLVSRPRLDRLKARTCNSRPQMNLISHEKLEVLFSSEETEVAKYKLEIQIPASYSKEKRSKSIRALKTNSQFKGFRKGTIPPFIMKDIPSFVLRDSIEELLKQAVKELNLELNEGEAYEPDLDMEEMKGRFKVGEDFAFTCEMALSKSLESAAEDLMTAEGDSSPSE